MAPTKATIFDVAGRLEHGLLVRFAGTQQAIDLPGSNGPEQFVRLKLIGQGDKRALLPGPDMQAVS